MIPFSRVTKTDYEKDVMRYAAEMSSKAHKVVMKLAKPGMYEYQCESEFLHYVYSNGGCRHVAYTCVCASGPNGSILHYGHAAKPNDKLIRNGDLWFVVLNILFIFEILIFYRLKIKKLNLTCTCVIPLKKLLLTSFMNVLRVSPPTALIWMIFHEFIYFLN